MAFYCRLETLLARCGHVRTASQTPQEFVQQAADSMAAACGDAAVADWVGQIVRAFYEVRFGPGALAAEQTAKVELSLKRLAQAARRKPASLPRRRI